MIAHGYQYDIFISYRRGGETRDWLKEHLIPALEHCLHYELDRKPEIFVDTHLSVDMDWQRRLGQELGRSRILISLWSRNYLDSEYCILELSHMLKREKETNCHSQERPNGLIAVPVIHDGDTIPPRLHNFQRLEIQDFFNPRMSRTCTKAEQLYDRIKDNAVALAKLIENAPPWNPTWPNMAVDEFYDVFKKRAPSSQHSPPRFTTP